MVQTDLHDQALPQTKAQSSGFPIPNALRSWTRHNGVCPGWCRDISGYRPEQSWAAQELYWKKSQVL